MYDIPCAESSLNPKYRSNGPQNRGGGVLHVGEWHEVEVDVFFLSLVTSIMAVSQPEFWILRKPRMVA